MRKILGFIFVVSSFNFPSFAFAASEGDYLELDGILTKTTYYSRDLYFSGKKIRDSISYRGGNNGIGITYKSAYNINQSNFFLAPGVFVEQNSFDSSGISGDYGSSLQIKNRLGARVDLGYDFANIVSPYITVGYAFVKYRSVAYSEDANYNIINSPRTGGKGSKFFGAGARFPLKNKNFSLNFEYNYQRVDTKNAIPASAADYIYESSYRTRLDIFKAGLAYKF